MDIRGQRQSKAICALSHSGPLPALAMNAQTVLLLNKMARGSTPSSGILVEGDYEQFNISIMPTPRGRSFCLENGQTVAHKPAIIAQTPHALLHTRSRQIRTHKPSSQFH
ncbi:hypothetical protein BDZ89DRAFT_279627 [Hymenopellis radicata]|nr:hypothetical protein BDZ89DRAFT_279627 [Hymenopellis radicata]